MTIKEQVAFTIENLINEYGTHHKVSRQELLELLESTFGTNRKSVIPSDYCYNRTNKGIEFSKSTRLLLFLGDGMYECLGENYNFNGDVYTREKGSKVDVVVGTWKEGIFYQNENWNLCGLK